MPFKVKELARLLSETSAASTVRTARNNVESKLKCETSIRWMGRSNLPNRLPIAVDVVGLFFPQRKALGFDARESTPGLKRKLVFLNAESRSLKRASLSAERVLEIRVSPNTIERISQDVGEDLESAAAENWVGVIDGEAIVPKVAIVSCDGGRIRTRQCGQGPGVHLSGKGWNETKNAIFVSATSETSEADPEPSPPKCFFDPAHVSKLTETARTKENAAPDEDLEQSEQDTTPVNKSKRKQPPHKPRRIHRTIISSMKNSSEFGEQMNREANRRRFGESSRKAFVGDGLSCNWTIHATHFSDYVPILDFIHAVSYLYRASLLCCGHGEESWDTYSRWMTLAWQGGITDVLKELRSHQQRMGLPSDDVSDDDPREQLRLTIGYLENNRERMKYDEYRCAGLPTTSAWMESAIKEINFRVKGTEMFWNNPHGAEAILQIRSASLCDDDRLARLLSHRPGRSTIRHRNGQANAA